MFANYLTTTYEIADEYKRILVDSKTAKIKIEPSNDNDTEIVFFQKKKRPYEYSIQDHTLIIKPIKRKWYSFIKIGIDHSEIKLCVPKSILDAIIINSTVGCVDICSISCSKTIDLHINTGKINLENVYCENFHSKGNTGPVSLSNFIAKENISIERNTGKVLLNDCSAPEIFVKTNTGNVCGRLPTNTIFMIKTNTGKIEIPNNTTVGEIISAKCEVKTNTGNIKFE